MTQLGYHTFLKGLPTHIRPHLPRAMLLHIHQPHRWLVQIYDQDKRVHYEIQRIPGRGEFEIGLHFESRNKELNQRLLEGFSRYLFEIHALLGESVVAEPWDKGWAKVYEVVEVAEMTEDAQKELGKRVAEFIQCIHPMLQEIYADSTQRRKVK